jgi:hypothetical protein
MSSAAEGGHLHICKYLLSQQCPCDAGACDLAARAGHVDVIVWLREQGCPWDVRHVRLAAAQGGRISVLHFMQSFEPAASAAQLTELLNVAGALGHLETARWLQLQGAEWPAVLMFDEASWTGATLQWARDEGCTSPTN